MQFVVCDAPTGSLEPTDITSLVIHTDWLNRNLSAFWTVDGDYVLKAVTGSDVCWYRIDAEMSPALPVDEAQQLVLGAMLSNVFPIGGGHVAFPIGSSGRRVYRVWSSKGNAKGAASGGRRTKILGVRAARSRRLPA